MGGGEGPGLGQGGDGADAGGGESLGRPLPRVVGHRVGPADRPLQVGGVTARTAHRRPVFAGVGADRELHRAAPAHVPRRGLHLDGFEAHTVEDAAVGAPVRLELNVQPGFIQVEGVGVLHGELPHPQQAGTGTGFVPELGLQVIPELGEFLVGGELGRQMGEHLLVGEGQHQVGPLAVLELDHDAFHVVPAPGLLPQLARVHHRRQELLPPDGVHLLPDDAGDLAGHPHPQRQERVGTGHQLPDEPPAHQQPVAGGGRVGRVLPEGGYESSRPAHRGLPGFLSASAAAPD